MGHTRLAILNMSERAAQPKWSDDGNVLLTFNGEIYNFKQLTTKEEASDTVALCNWLARSGLECDLSRLDGMYGFAHFLQEKGRFCPRPRPGGDLKPLYIAVSEAGDHLAFSSEIKGFFGVEWFEARPNRDAEIQRQVLQYGYTLSDCFQVRILGKDVQLTLVPTLLEGVFQLCPGQKLTVALAGEVSQSFVSLPAEPCDPLAALQAASSNNRSPTWRWECSFREGSIRRWWPTNMPGQRIGPRLLRFDRGSRYQRGQVGPSCRRLALQAVPVPLAHDSRDAGSGVKGAARRGMVHGRAGHSAPERGGRLPVVRVCSHCTPVRVLLTGEGADEMFGGYGWHDGRTVSDFDKAVAFRRWGVRTGQSHFAHTLIFPRSAGNCITTARCTCHPSFSGKTA